MLFSFLTPLTAFSSKVTVNKATTKTSSYRTHKPFIASNGLTTLYLFSKYITFYDFLSGSSHSVSCQKVTSLEFGGAFSAPTAGTVIVDPNTNIARSATGGVLLNTQKPGHPALVQITLYNKKHCDDDDHEDNDDNECDRDEDDDNHSNDSRTGFTRHGVYNTISLPNSSTLRRINGTETMSADNFKINRTNGNIYIGATLHVNANQVSGVYSGTFTVTAVCN